MDQAPASRPARAPRQTVQPAPREQTDAALAQVAAAAGATLHEDAYGRQCVVPTSDAHALREGFVAPLTDLSVLTVHGADAAAFLHAQLTNDVSNLEAGAARLAGYCSPKGRLLATWLLWRGDDAVSLIAVQPMAATLAARLGLYVLRAKATMRDDAARTALLGVVGARGAAALAALGCEPPAPMRVAPLGGATGGVAGPGSDEAGVAVGLAPVAAPWGEQPRWIAALPTARLVEALPELLRQAPAAGSAAWRWTEVLAGVPRIAGGAVERFVPQMVNLEVVGGVDFRKGCYPGQEVVARSQYLGRLKRRMFAARVDGAEPAPGADVLADGAPEPVGQVVLAAPDPAGGVALLFEAPLDRVRAAPLRLTPEGAALQLRELPYTVPV